MQFSSGIPLILVILCYGAESLDLNQIKKMKTEPTTIPTTTTPTTTTTTPTTTTTTVTTTTTELTSTTTRKPITFSMTSMSPMLTECTAGCPAGWLYRLSRCYKKFDIPGTYDQASTACKAQGAQLTNIESADENDALRKAFDTNALVDETKATWIGMKFYYGSWYTAEMYSPSYMNWAPTQPAKADEGQCVQMITDALSNATYLYQRGGWKTYDCSKTSASYICEKQAMI